MVRYHDTQAIHGNTCFSTGELMRRLILAILLCSSTSWAQTNFGGVKSVPPWPDQEGSNLVSNPGFETGDTTGWSFFPGCGSIVSSEKRSGTYSAKFTACGATFMLRQAPTLPGTLESVIFRAWVTTSSDYDGPTLLSLDTFDNTHGSGSGFGGGRRVLEVGPNTTRWVQIISESFPVGWSHQSDVYNFRLKADATWTAGSLWFDDVELVPAWYPLRTFIKWPNDNRQYLWSDKTPNPWPYNQGSATVAGHIYGVTTIIPPSGLTADDLDVEVDTTSGCATPIDSVNVSTPTSEEHWDLDLTSETAESSPTTVYYVCSTVTWSDVSTTSYTEWEVYYVNSTFRAGLMNWFDIDGAWVHNSVRQIAHGTYDRDSGAFSCSPCLFVAGTDCTPNQSTGKDCYIKNIRSMGDWSPKNENTSVGAGTGTTPVIDYRAMHFNTILSNFTGFSVVKVKTGEDQLTPWLGAAQDYDFSHIQIANNWYGYMVNENNTAAGPSAPTLNFFSTGGEINSSPDAWVYVKITAARASGAWQTPETGTLISEPSSEAHNATVLTGSTNRVEVTVPSCPVHYLGYYIYAAGNTTESEPADSNFYKQGTEAIWVDCGSTTNITFLRTAGIQMPTADNSNNSGRPIWTPDVTDQTMWQTLVERMEDHVGAAAMYLYDEPSNARTGTVLRQRDTMISYAPGIPVFGVQIGAFGGLVWREIADIPSSDPYGYGIGRGGNEYWAGQDARSCTSFDSGTVANQRGTVANCNVTRVDVFTNELSRDTWGSRAQWTVPQEWGRGGHSAFTYGEMWRQYWKAMIACEQWGNNGCGIITWGWVSSVGMEDMWWDSGHTEAYYEHQDLAAYFMGLEDVLLDTTEDSPIVSTVDGNAVDSGSGRGITGGIVLSNVKTDTATGTVCGTSGYTNTTDFPFGPERFVTKKMDNGDLYIFATALCHDAAYNVTFTVVSPPSSTVMVWDSQGTSNLTITANKFTDARASVATQDQDLDSFVYLIRSPRQTDQQGQVSLGGGVTVQ
jgi:hypothetical protein